MSEKILNDFHTVMKAHYIVGTGMTGSSPDRCVCEAKLYPVRDEELDEFTDISVLRGRAFADHMKVILKPIIGIPSEAERAIDRVESLASALEKDAPKPQWGGFIAEEIRNRIKGTS